MKIHFDEWLLESYPDFIDFVKNYCLLKLDELFDDKKALFIEQYINTNLFGEYRRDVKLKNICEHIIKNLSVHKTSSSTMLWIEPTDCYMDSTIKLETLYNIMEYGNIDTDGYHILSNIADTVENQLPEIFVEFDRENTK